MINKKHILTILAILFVFGILVLVFVNSNSKEEACWEWLQSLQEDEITVTVMYGEIELTKEEKEELLSLIKQTSKQDIRELVDSAIGDGSVHWFNIITSEKEYRLNVSFVKLYDVGIKYDGVEYVITNSKLKEYMKEVIGVWQKKTNIEY